MGLFFHVIISQNNILTDEHSRQSLISQRKEETYAKRNEHPDVPSSVAADKIQRLVDIHCLRRTFKASGSRNLRSTTLPGLFAFVANNRPSYDISKASDRTAI